MRPVAAAVILAALGAITAHAQQPVPQPGQGAVPPKQSAEADMGGPAEEPEARAVSAARAEPRRSVRIVPGADPATIVALAKSRGDARLLADSYGDPLIEAIIEGRPYDITFYDCTANVDCQSIMLRAAFRADGQTGAEMADWNRSQRFGKAYLDAAGNPTVEMNVNLTGGVTADNLTDSFDRWQAVLEGFAGHAGY